MSNLKKLYPLLFRASVFIVFFHTLITIVLLYNRNWAEFLFYHHSSNLYWFCLWFIIPIAFSILIASRLKWNVLRQVGTILLPIVIMGNLVGTIFNKQYWGYFLVRPSVFSEVKDIKFIVQIGMISGQKDSLSITEFQCDSPHLFRTQNYDPYYAGIARPMMAVLETKNSDPSSVDWCKAISDSSSHLSALKLEEMFGLVLRANLLDTPRYVCYAKSASRLSGRVLRFQTHSGKRYTHVGLRTGEVDNDHYANYEILFTQEKPYKIIKYQKYYVDIAGIEGLEYARLIGMGETLVLIALSLLALLFYIGKSLFNHKKRSSITAP